MEYDNKLKAPKPIVGFRTPNLNFRSDEGVLNRNLLMLISPKKKETSINNSINANFFKLQENNEDIFDIEKELLNDFEELSVKSEIFSILKNDSTRCDSFDIRYCNSSKLYTSNHIFEENYSIENEDQKSSPNRNRNLLYKNFNISKFKSEDLPLSDIPVFNICKKII